MKLVATALAAAAALCSMAHALVARDVVVVYNADSPLSKRCTEAYCAKRSIPLENVVGLHGVKAADISRPDYNHLVMEPLMMEARVRGWRWPANPKMPGRRMAAILLMPDMPLRVQSAANLPKQFAGSGNNSASLDSELMGLGSLYPLGGPLGNPAYKKDGNISDYDAHVLSVCRIDAPDEATIMRMINDPAEVERRGLWGWAVVDQGGPYPEGDTMFKAAASYAKVQGFPLFYETSKQTIGADFPLMDHVAVYWGWYNERPNGPFARSAPQFRFEKGAVAYHLHSFSALSVKSPDQWVCALLQRGAAVTAGNVAEPYLGGCLNPEIFFARLLRGYTVAEAALMATPATSWQGVVLGDPLYRPFAARKAANAGLNAYTQWREMYAKGSANVGSMESLVTSRLRTPDAPVLAEAFAWYCTENARMDKAAEYFRMAAQLSQTPRDWTRNTLMQITVEYVRGEKAVAESLMKRMLEQTLSSPYRKAIEQTADTVVEERRKARAAEAAARAKAAQEAAKAKQAAQEAKKAKK
ncbi:MAG: TIGR03790 family protein [Akkermansia sp.]|nr:TIGR03790 family protein [Akkermansia sp.]